MEASLEQLCNALWDAKARENEAKADRIAIEEAIASMVDGPEQGSKTEEVKSNLKVTVTRSLLYKVDNEALKEVAPALIVPQTKEVFDKKAYEALREKDYEAWKKASEHVTSRPGKVSVALKV